jgi:hypothetical protein
MDFPTLLTHSLTYGAILSVLLIFTFLALFLISPASWVHDYPPDIKAAFGEMDARSRQWQRIAVIPTLLIMFGVPIWSVVRLADIGGPALTFWDVALSVFIVATTFNLVDLVILDWLVFVTWQPKRIVLPGTEGLAGYKDYGFHLKASLKGQVGIFVVSLVFAAVTVLII